MLKHWILQWLLKVKHKDKIECADIEREEIHMLFVRSE